MPFDFTDKRISGQASDPAESTTAKCAREIVAMMASRLRRTRLPRIGHGGHSRDTNAPIGSAESVWFLAAFATSAAGNWNGEQMSRCIENKCLPRFSALFLYLGSMEHLTRRVSYGDLFANILCVNGHCPRSVKHTIY